ncbi:VPS10 domain-containing receptor SorCS1 [Varanus komodoensis]|nr:VPS10 domain-containing receptor SorCS1 [Varanus komodoensis]
MKWNLGQQYRKKKQFFMQHIVMKWSKSRIFDYGFERHSNGQCLPAFWYNPLSLSKDCSLGQSYLNSTGYRKVVSNNCTDGVREQYTAKPQQCPGKAPRGLRVVTSDGTLTSEQGHNVTFMVQLEEVWSISHMPHWAFGV